MIDHTEESEVIFRYFLAEGPEAAAVLADAKQKRKEHDEKLSQLLEKYQADALWGGRTPIGIAFRKTTDDPLQLKENFLKPYTEYCSKTKVRYAIYKPDRRYKGGKDIAKDLESISDFRFSEYATKAFNVNRRVFGPHSSSRTGMAMFQASAGFYKGDIFVFRIPFGGDLTTDEKFVIPACFREIKKSEFVAITEEGE